MFCGKAFAFISFTVQTIYSIVLTFVLFLLFYFGIPINPIIAIGLKSLVSLTYVYLNYKFVLSSQINQSIDGLLCKKLNATKIFVFLYIIESLNLGDYPHNK
jgi:hypothetical protein